MAIDYELIAAAGGISKGKPRTIRRKEQTRSEALAWEKCKKAVDARDKFRCQITGKPLGASPDGWADLHRAHLIGRAQDKARRYVVENVITMARSVHQLYDGAAFFLRDAEGNDAETVDAIDYLEWNRNIVAIGDTPPFVVRPGLPVLGVPRVRD